MEKSRKIVVTRIVRSKDMNGGKLRQLSEIARRLAEVRSHAWRVFGGVNGLSVSTYDVRNRTKRHFDGSIIPSRLRFATAMDCANDMKAYRAAAKVSVHRQVFARTSDKAEQTRLFTLLKSDKWVEDKWLSRVMRDAYRHGRSRVRNQIVLEQCDYSWFELHGHGWIAVQSFKRGKRIAIPLASNQQVSGIIRLIISHESVLVHHTIEAPLGRPCGAETIGVDRGYTEVFVDSDGASHGNTLGVTLSLESDYLKSKYQSRNKLQAIAEKSSLAKRAKINRNNLGRKKLNRRKCRHQMRVKNIVAIACHSVFDKAKVIASEDLTGVIKSNKPRSANQKRRLSGWVKGVIAKTLEEVSHRRSSSVVVVNCAYTSQTCSCCERLGDRIGDKFHCTSCGAVEHADHNAAKNVLARIHDPEIGRWTPFAKVKSILQARSAQRSRQTDLESSCAVLASTDSECSLL